MNCLICQNPVNNCPEEDAEQSFESNLCDACRANREGGEEWGMINSFRRL